MDNATTLFYIILHLFFYSYFMLWLGCFTTDFFFFNHFLFSAKLESVKEANEDDQKLSELDLNGMFIAGLSSG